MTPSARFIAFALLSWVGVRALSLGLVPGGEALAFDRPRPGAAALPPLVTTEFAPLDPVTPPAPAPAPALAAAPYAGTPYGAAYPPPYPPPAPAFYGVPVAYAAGVSRAPAVIRYAASVPRAERWGPADSAGFDLSPAAARYAAATPLEQWPIAAIAGASPTSGEPAQSTPVKTTPASAAEWIRRQPGIDRLSMSAWAMLRRESGSPSLATNGQLGGSQAGSRLLWRFHPNFAASLRTSAPIGGVTRTAEVAAGLRFQPFRSLPLALSAERRQSFGRDHGPGAFAIFAEGGLYQRPIVAGFNLDAYLQAGVVGLRDRALFVDGSATLTRPIWRQLSGGVGVWGGAQPGLARLDAGPRLTWRIGKAMRVHVDYRQRLVGRAAPGSGPVITLAGDF